MSNRRDDFSFDDSDDFFNDDSDPFGDIDSDSDVGRGLGDSFDEDMPDRSAFEEERTERGTSPTFIILAVLLIFMFMIGLGAILLLATRDTGPTPFDQTSTAIALTNAQVVAFLAQTQTQDVSNLQLTQTALAASPTPSPTATPSDTPTPTDTPPRPTITPTFTPDLTLAFLQTLVAQQTADAAATANVTLPPPATATPFIDAGGDLRQRFATEVAFSTLVAGGRQSELATQQALATQGAIDLQGAAADLRATVEAERQVAQLAIDDINARLDAAARERNELALALTAVSLENSQTRAALEAPFAAATQVAVATQAAAATLVSDLAFQFGDPALAQPGGIATALAQATQAAVSTQFFFEQAATAGADIVTPAVLATQVSTATRAALDVQANVGTQVAIATQNAFDAPRQFATQGAIATQVAIATRNALIELALFSSPTPGPTQEFTPTVNVLESFNLTATAIAGQFLTATAQVFTPDAVTLPPPTPGATGELQILPSPTRLPDSGIFDDVISGTGGGTTGMVLIVIGLIGVLFTARALRAANRRALDAARDDAPPRQ
jgi:hypothetical protein